MRASSLPLPALETGAIVALQQPDELPSWPQLLLTRHPPLPKHPAHPHQHPLPNHSSLHKEQVGTRVYHRICITSQQAVCQSHKQVQLGRREGQQLVLRGWPILRHRQWQSRLLWRRSRVGLCWRGTCERGLPFSQDGHGPSLLKHG